MFGLGPTELIVILVLAIVLLGPRKLPEVASGLGKAIRQFRKATRDLTSQLDIDDEVKQPFQELKAALRDEPTPYVPPPLPNVVAAATASVVPPDDPGVAKPAEKPADAAAAVDKPITAPTSKAG